MSWMSLIPLGIQLLSGHGVKKMLQGQGVRVKHGQGHQIKVDAQQYKKIMAAHRKGKAFTIHMNPWQIEQNMHLLQGGSLLGSLGSAFKTVAPVLGPVLVDAAAQALKSKLGGSGVRRGYDTHGEGIMDIVGQLLSGLGVHQSKTGAGIMDVIGSLLGMGVHRGGSLPRAASERLRKKHGQGIFDTGMQILSSILGGGGIHKSGQGFLSSLTKSVGPTLINLAAQEATKALVGHGVQHHREGDGVLSDMYQFGKPFAKRALQQYGPQAIDYAGDFLKSKIPKGNGVKRRGGALMGGALMGGDV